MFKYANYNSTMGLEPTDPLLAPQLTSHLVKRAKETGRNLGINGLSSGIAAGNSDEAEAKNGEGRRRC